MKFREFRGFNFCFRVETHGYGKALMIHWKDWQDEKRRTAMTVRYDPRTDKNVLDAVFRCGAMPSY